MDTNVAKNSQTNVMQLIQQTAPSQIPELDFVKNRYITNYNACNKEKVGELMYHRQMIHFKQILANSEDLRGADPFSLYACFVTAAANGYSMDPSDNEIYLIPRGGKAYLQKQAGAYVRRLIRTNQIQYAEQPKIVYQGDDFEVLNGRVLKHIERFTTEIMVAGYVRFVIDDKGNDRFFIYRRSDWEAWRNKSPQKNGPNWNTNNQPVPGFLRTKLVLHACNEKCWATGQTPANVEQFEDVEVDVLDDESKQEPAIAAKVIESPAASSNGSFHTAEEKKSDGIKIDDGTF